MKAVWIDCDPGVDDATALMLLHQLPVKIVGISTVAGNAHHQHTFDNARKLIHFLGKKTKVYPGAEKPLIQTLHTAPYIHGVDGLAGVSLEAPSAPVETIPAWDGLYQAAKKYGKDLEVVAIGPLTNIAIALAKYPDLAKMLPRIIIMGGSATSGNISPSAEFNIYVDPEAAKRVFESLFVVMFGLDVTMKAYLTPDELDQLANPTSKEGSLVRDMMNISRKFCQSVGLPGVPLHDVCSVLYLQYPELFSLHPAWVGVETKGSISRGKTVTDLFSDKKLQEKNALVALDVDREQFVARFMELIGRYSDETSSLKP